MELRSKRIEATDLLEAIEICFERRWSDGLPVVPPVLEKVEEMVRYVGRDPLEALGEIPPKHGIATIEKLAINCVMAGCKPEYFPVVIAAVEAIARPTSQPGRGADHHPWLRPPHHRKRPYQGGAKGELW